MLAFAAFEEQLGNAIGRPSMDRPFICRGSPLACEVFLCGFNAASPTSTDFWTYWKSPAGFDKDAWFQSYKQERLARPLKPGRTRRAAVSNTRRVIDWIVEAAAPLRCLETNIHSTPSESMADFEPTADSTAAFRFLLSAIEPRLVVVHGIPAEEFMTREFAHVPVLAVEHFSRGWSKDKAQALGRSIADQLGNG